MAKRFSVKLTCCGRDEGTQEFRTWGEADSFRDAYLSGPGTVGDTHGGHVRSAIIVDGPIRLGTTWCQVCEITYLGVCSRHPDSVG